MMASSQVEPTAASSNQILPAGYDGGNGSVKLVVDGAEVRIPSYFHPLRQHELLEAPENCGDGSLVEYLDGDRTDLIGRQWLTGGPAYRHNPQHHQRVVDDPSAKFRLGLQMLLGAVGVLPHRPQWNLHLTTSIHDAQSLGEKLNQSLNGAHTIRLNGGMTSQVSVTSSAVEEGVGAIVVATISGLVSPNSQVCVVDLGHGTLIASTFGPKGALIKREQISGGVDCLVSAIAKNLDTRRQLLGVGDREIIRRGIEDGSFDYGYSGWNFREIYVAELSPWCGQILAPALKFLAPWRPLSKATLAIGGGATLPAINQLLAKQQISALPDSMWANARGLFKLSQLKMRKG